MFEWKQHRCLTNETCVILSIYGALEVTWMGFFFKSRMRILLSCARKISIHVHFGVIKQCTRLIAGLLSWIETIYYASHDDGGVVKVVVVWL